MKQKRIDRKKHHKILWRMVRKAIEEKEEDEVCTRVDFFLFLWFEVEGWVEKTIC